MTWLYNDNIVTTINDVPNTAIGFVYLVHFTDGSKYIGKKNLYSIRKIKALTSGKQRKDVIEKKYRNTGKGYRQEFDIIKKESDWLKYQGSHKDCKTKTVDKKYILCFAYSKLQLTYLEAKMLFIYEVLEDNSYLNDNILGTFYRSNLQE